MNPNSHAMVDASTPVPRMMRIASHMWMDFSMPTFCVTLRLLSSRSSQADMAVAIVTTPTSYTHVFVSQNRRDDPDQLHSRVRLTESAWRPRTATLTCSSHRIGVTTPNSYTHVFVSQNRRDDPEQLHSRVRLTESAWRPRTATLTCSSHRIGAFREYEEHNKPALKEVSNTVYCSSVALSQRWFESNFSLKTKQK